MRRRNWLERVRPGDVLETPRGRLRVVREVKRFNGYAHWFTFTIMHCSWTERCVTVMNRHDILGRRYRPTGKRLRLTKPIDRKIAREVEYRGKPRMTCCDVSGIP